MACGTGIYALAFARCGVRTVGVDISAGMLQKAEAHAQRLGLDVNWLLASMDQLAQQPDTRFDAVVCLGNSVPHLLTDAELSAALKSFHAVLNPGGQLYLQLLNYDLVQARHERIVEINRQDNREFVRFYDFRDDGLLQFNVLSLDWSAGPDPVHALQSTVLRPYHESELRTALHARGFAAPIAFGNLAFAPFDPAASDTVLLVAAKA